VTGRHHIKFLIPVTLGILLLSTIGLSACYQAAPATPVTPAPSGGTTPPAEQPAPAEGTTPTPAEQPTPVTMEVTISDFAFSPATVTVPVGATVTWTNKGSTHTVTSNNKLFDKTLSRGSTFNYTFDQAGSFQYLCNLHPSMTGKIIVGAGTSTVPAGGTTTAAAGGSTTTSSSGTATTGNTSSDYNYSGY